MRKRETRKYAPQVAQSQSHSHSSFHFRHPTLAHPSRPNSPMRRCRIPTTRAIHQTLAPLLAPQSPTATPTKPSRGNLPTVPYDCSFQRPPTDAIEQMHKRRHMVGELGRLPTNDWGRGDGHTAPDGGNNEKVGLTTNLTTYLPTTLTDSSSHALPLVPCPWEYDMHRHSLHSASDLLRPPSYYPNITRSIIR